MNKIGVKQIRPVLRAVPQAGTAIYHIAYDADLSADAPSSVWERRTPVRIGHFHEDSSSHRPKTEARAAWNDDGVLIRFAVQDRYVRAIRTQYQDFVSKDSCVEAFLQPRADAGYFNFEINCIGTMLLYYIEDSSKPSPANGDSFTRFKKVPERLARQVQIRPSIRQSVESEIATKLSLGSFPLRALVILCALSPEM